MSDEQRAPSLRADVARRILEHIDANKEALSAEMSRGSGVKVKITTSPSKGRSTMAIHTRTRAQAQTGLWDVTLDNPGLAELLEEHQEAKAAARSYNALNKDLKKRLAELQPTLQADVRYRVGRFVITPTMREGGGIDIPEWRTVSYGVKALKGTE